MRSLSARLAPLVSSRREAAAAPQLNAKRGPAVVPPLRPRIDIPVSDPDPETEAQDRHRSRGRFLARQEAWEDLGREICEADAARRLTPGLTPVAQLLAEGARQDAVGAITQAIAKGEPRSARMAMAALEANSEDALACPAFEYVVAMAHVDAAYAWRGTSRVRDLPPQRRNAYDQHLDAAATLADRHDPFVHNSALWAQARVAVLEADLQPSQRVADDYEDLIDLNPACPQHMTGLGLDLLPRRFGSYECLDVQARRTAARVADVWGNGGYTWVMIGALEHDIGAFRRLDAELFVAGLHDILERHPTQVMVNRLAAFTGLTLSGASATGPALTRVADSFEWITQDHLQELHPLVWANAPMAGRTLDTDADTADLMRSGKARAFSAIAERFAPQISAGQILSFSAKGMRVRQGD